MLFLILISCFYSIIFFIHFNIHSILLENLLLKEQLILAKFLLNKKKRKVKTSIFHKLFWVLVSRFYSSWKNVSLLCKPNTILKWHKTIYKLVWKFISRKKSGRPSVKKDLIDTIHLIASSNPSWLATRILGELEKLGFNVSLNTVKKYLQVKRRNNPLGSDSTWKQFLELHKDVITAFDFFTIPTWSCKQLFLFFIIHHKNRTILSINATLHPTREWLQQQFKNAFYENVNLKYLIHDNDILFRSLDSFFLSNFQIKGIPTSFHSPWENGIAERFVRTIREELFRFFLFLM